MTDGLFDCTIEPVMEAWGFTTQNFRIPSEEELEELLSHVDYKQVDLENSTVTIPEDVRLDLGGIAKGFTSSRVMDISVKWCYQRHYLPWWKRTGFRTQTGRKYVARRHSGST